MADPFDTYLAKIRGCNICAARFQATHTAHEPRPMVWLSQAAPILIIGQAPGARVHASGRPFTDPSGDRLRGWMGVDEAAFYDQSKFAIMPMAFCFPGYNAKGSDLPPPPICAKTWHEPAVDWMGEVRLTLLIGGYAQKRYLKSTNVTNTVRNWRDHAPGIIPLPHPSWRNTAWLKKNPWFAAELLPVLRARVQELI
ncbi:MAG: uracil-DNA glycosylase family protein [Rhodobacteraceae bacterium]|nr:uracil-DNA glycosylase family protein [Paracoccaceae bacterium]